MVNKLSEVCGHPMTKSGVCVVCVGGECGCKMNHGAIIKMEEAVFINLHVLRI